MKKLIEKSVVTCIVFLFLLTNGLYAKAAFVERTSAPPVSDARYYSNQNPYFSVAGAQNCTNYVYGRAWEILGNRPDLGAMGNAGDWWNNNAGGNRYPYGNTPKLGAIACWGKSGSTIGHIAIVEKITGSTLTMSEAWYKANDFNLFRREASDMYYTSPTYGTYYFQGYIYLLENAQTSTNPDDYPQVSQDFYLTSPVMMGSQVGYIQAVLKYLGYDIAVDQSYGPATRDVMKLFQRDYGLTVDGSCGALTRAKLIEAYQEKKNENNKPSHETTPPVISEVRVTDITSTGYTVSCRVVDESGVNRVQFPTWTGANGQDDIQPEWGTNSAASGMRSGDTFTYRIEDSDHNYERGIYATHIYAFDNYGNAAYNGTIQVNLKNMYQPSGSVTYKGYTYELYDDLLSWAGAREKCQKMGGMLASISSKDVQEVIVQLIAKGKREAFYIGGSDEAQEGKFKWLDGSYLSYSNWSPGQPDNYEGNENYIEILKNGLWNDGKGRLENRGFILQQKAKASVNTGNGQKPGTGQAVGKKPAAGKQSDKISKPVFRNVIRKNRSKIMLRIHKVKNAKGYQIQYALNAKFTKGRKQIVTRKLSCTLRDLRKKKTYYVRIRAYRVNTKGKKIYGKFSKIKKVI